jgi:thiol-disulfide isomerase/thioredoxin
MKRLSIVIFIVACLSMVCDINAQGKAAAKVSVDVISNGKTKAFNLADHKDKVVVVEFWATWCPPCRATIPHLSKLQKKYGDKVVILGVSSETKDVVQAFYKKMKNKMKYLVAVDKNGSTTAGYMEAYGVTGIPHAFIVKNGKVVWHGHPGKMDAELDKAVNAKKRFMDLDLNRSRL